MKRKSICGHISIVRKRENRKRKEQARGGARRTTNKKYLPRGRTFPYCRLSNFALNALRSIVCRSTHPTKRAGFTARCCFVFSKVSGRTINAINGAWFFNVRSSFTCNTPRGFSFALVSFLTSNLCSVFIFVKSWWYWIATCGPFCITIACWAIEAKLLTGAVRKLSRAAVVADFGRI